MSEEPTAAENFLDEYVTMVTQKVEKAREIIAWLAEKKIAVPIDDCREGFFIRPDTQVSSAEGTDDIITWLLKHGVRTSQFICDYHVIHIGSEHTFAQRLWFLRPNLEKSPLTYAEDRPSEQEDSYSLLAYAFNYDWPLHRLSAKEIEQINQFIAEQLADYSAPKAVVSSLIKSLKLIQTNQEDFIGMNAFEAPSDDEALSDQEMDEFAEELGNLDGASKEEVEANQLKSAIRDVVLMALREHIGSTKPPLKLI